MLSERTAKPSQNRLPSNYRGAVFLPPVWRFLLLFPGMFLEGRGIRRRAIRSRSPLSALGAWAGATLADAGANG